MNNPKLVLYVGEGCPYCKKVTDYLGKNPLPIEIKEVWSNEENAKELKALTERTQVPCLKLDKGYMLESSDIIEKLKELHKRH